MADKKITQVTDMAAAMAQQQAMNSKPLDWGKILQSRPKKVCPVNYLDLSKYEDMPLRYAATPIIQEVQDKINELVDRINKL